MNLCLAEKISHYKNTRNTEILKEILLQMEPLVIRYAKKTFVLEFEDAKQEYYIVIINACNKIRMCENDAQCLKYIKSSIKNKYCTLCKEYYAIPEMLPIDEDMLWQDDSYNDIVMKNDILLFLQKLPDKKNYQKKIFYYATYMEMSDAEIGDKLGLTRQYVHLLRMKTAKMLAIELDKNTLQSKV